MNSAVNNISVCCIPELLFLQLRQLVERLPVELLGALLVHELGEQVRRHLVLQTNSLLRA